MNDTNKGHNSTSSPLSPRPNNKSFLATLAMIATIVAAIAAVVAIIINLFDDNQESVQYNEQRCDVAIEKARKEFSKKDGYSERREEQLPGYVEDVISKCGNLEKIRKTIQKYYDIRCKDPNARPPQGLCDELQRLLTDNPPQ